MTPRFVDIHHHLAYGVDDGPSNRKAMYRMLERAAKEGICTTIATSHATPGVQRFDLKAYRSALKDARAYCRSRGLDLTILEGCEILYTNQAVRMLQEGAIPTLAGTDFVLVEFSPDVKYARLREALQRLASGGYRPVVAHVERYDCITAWPWRVAKLKEEMEVFFQINCSSVTEKKGLRVRFFVKWMLKNRMVDALGTDAHNTSFRPANMKKAWRTVRDLCGKKTARALTTAAFMGEDLLRILDESRREEE